MQSKATRIIKSLERPFLMIIIVEEGLFFLCFKNNTDFLWKNLG